MAGDLPFEEVLVIHDAGAPSAEPRAAELVRAGEPTTPVLQRFGDRVEIHLGADEGTGARIPEVPEAVLESLSETERFGVEALQLRASPEFATAKADRPYDGERWDMPGCVEAPDAGLALIERREALSPGALEALAGAPGTSDYLMGSIALGVVIVNGPTAATQFSAAEQTKVVAEVQAGAGWLAGFNRWAGVSFNYDIRVVNIATQPDAAASDNESRFRNPAVAELGFQANWNGVIDYVNWLRTNRRTNWAYCVFFVKGYPLNHFAYASIGGPRIIMDYANDGWGPDNIDRVFAHETGHIFRAPDEYASSGCDCDGSWGRFGEPNSNCENCAGAAGVGCLMRANEWLMCGATKRHLGWGLSSMRTRQPSVCNVVSRSTDKLDVFVCDGGGNTVTAAWEPAMVSWWEGWWSVRGGRAAPGAPVTAVSRRPDFLDVFVVGTDGRVYTAAWSPSRGWQGWWPIGNVVFPQGGMINAVVRSQDHLDIFATDTSGRVLTAAWEPAFTDGWHGWWHIRGGRAQAGAPVTAVSRSTDKLDVFVVGTDGRPYTAAWTPTSGGWQGWWSLNGGMAAHGSIVTAVRRRPDFMDVFVIGLDGRGWTAAWSPGKPWAGWWPMGK